MKFITKNFKIEGSEWVKIQNEALKFLESQKQKINQQIILDFATDGCLEATITNEFRENSQKIKDFQFFFRPIILNKESNINQLSFELKSFYFDKEDLKDLSSNNYKDLDFSLNPGYEMQISEFTKSYISNFKFREDKGKEAVVSDTDVVRIEVKDLKKGLNQKFELVASKDLDEINLEKFIIGKQVGQKFIYKPNNDFELEVLVLGAFKVVSEPITDLNAHKIGIEELKTLSDVKKYIYDSLMEQIVGEALFEYGWRIVESIKEENNEIELPEELIQSDINAFNFAPSFEGNKEEIVHSSIVNYFWFNWVARKFDISITNNELNYEVKRVKTFLNMENNKQVDIKKVADAILMKKLAVKVLKESKNSFIDEFDKYIIFEEKNKA
ncbi:hypothetical protein MCANPG14_02870 [Mycoplasmopsis canis PG 14]|uniref:Trigger factor n=1 Tax=Mycoplasmopsis canis TaxID=29555 RepID=A0A449AS25_9BACT|nr:hypothetical protein [Mycoplasmopsis canis]AMD81535.1 hypothetical protein AXW82_03205 [Mycoplasmopsis canis PG 14]EIE39446.1 hypothetical protein MCANPG14_02870 [Mycoplasmopsis canis PG 14]VEU69166.1 Uncharacterised protein [Mycoplasmopsis canis]